VARVRGERGTATAELAVVLPALVLVAVLCVWAVTAIAVHVRCLDAARAGARALARGEAPAAVAASTSRAGPRGAQGGHEAVGEGLVAVEVRARVTFPGPWPGAAPGVTVGGRAVAEREDGATGDASHGPAN
jgi:hypothetical protein